MANTYTTLNSLFTAIANAIRSKTGDTQEIVADTFPTQIENLKTDFDYNNHEVTSIPNYAFYDCEDLKSVACYNLTSIGVSAFEDCKRLKTIVLYDGVTSVGENAFKGCSKVIIYCKAASQPDTWHENWNPDNRPVLYGDPIETWNISATKDDNVIAELYGIGSNYNLFIYGSGNMKNFASNNTDVVPWGSYKANIISTVVNNGVTSIGNFAFQNCSSLTSITIPDSVTSIGNFAFQNCRSLTSITIPDSITSVGDYTFYNCSGLISVTIPDGVTSIGDSAFYNCESLISITYMGTISQWNSITFDSDWNTSTGNYTIYCTNGTIAKDGTITYYN